MNTKICSKCKKEKLLKDFNKGACRGGVNDWCRDCSKIELKKWYYKRMKDKKWRLRWAKKTRLYYQNNLEKVKEQSKKKHLKIRLETLKMYSKSGSIECVCCGEKHYEFLAIDHIDGGGSKHMKTIKSKHLAFWLKQNNYPKGFQILCHNCNMAKGFYGKCPHQKNILQ